MRPSAKNRTWKCGGSAPEESVRGGRSDSAAFASAAVGGRLLTHVPPGSPMPLLYFALGASLALLVVENLAAPFLPTLVGIASGVGFFGTLVLIHGIAPWSLVIQTVIFVVLGGIWQVRGGAPHCFLSNVWRWRGGFGANRYLVLSVAGT